METPEGSGYVSRVSMGTDPALQGGTHVPPFQSGVPMLAVAKTALQAPLRAY